MKDRDDDGFLFVFLIQNRIGETLNDCLSNLFVNDGKESWIAGDPFDDLANFTNEISSESLPSSFVPIRCLVELRFRFGQESNSLPHDCNLDNASASTCSQAIAASGFAR